MRIKRARIQNFRCLEDTEIAFDTVTTFIGPNGVGKSTVLHALDWFFNGGRLTEEDLLQGAAIRRIRVEVEFDSLSPEDRRVLVKYAPESSDTVTIWRTWQAGDEKITGKALAYGPFEEIRLIASATERRAKYNEIRSAHSDLELPPAGSAAAVEEAMSVWEKQHPDLLTEAEVSDTNFFGFAGQGKMSGLFDFVLVTADLRAGEETQDARSALLGKIIERTIDRTAADGRLQELADQFLVDQGNIHVEHFGPTLEAVSLALSKEVAAFSSGRSIKINAVNPDPKPQKVQFSVSVLDNQTETRIDRQGHGFQRTLLIAALKFLANHGTAAGNQGVICLAIEEPELYQHPVQAKAFANVLRKLAENPNQQVQVTYATHSPSFIEATNFHQVRRVNRLAAPGKRTPLVNITRVTVAQVVQHLDGFMSADSIKKRIDAICLSQIPEALFAEAVVLVEGFTDQAVIEGCAEREGEAIAVNGTAVAEAGGKGSIYLPHAILTLLGIPCYVVFDGDKGCGDRMRKNGIKDEASIAREAAKHSKSNRDLLRYFGRPEEDWPSTRAEQRFAVFEDTLEAVLKEHWPAWFTKVNELVDLGIGFLDKNRATYYHATLAADEKAPDIFQEILATVRAIRAA